MPSQKRSSKTTEPIAFDAASAQKAFDNLKAELLAVPKDRIIVARVNMSLTVEGLILVLRIMRKHNIPDRFARLPKEEIAPGLFDRFEPLIWAAWHCERKSRLQKAGEDQRTLSPELEEEAKTVEKRMQGCVEYMLQDVKEAKAVLAHLAEGQGHQDLALDLMGYSDLYEQYEDLVKHDGRFYDPEDPARARALAARILDALGEDEQGAWSDLRDRAWTLLVEVYEEVASTARWLLRKDPADAAIIAPLYALGRSAPKASSQSTPSDDETSGSPERDR